MEYVDPELVDLTLQGLQSFRKQAEINGELSKALASTNIVTLQEALHKAEEIVLNNAIVATVKDKLKQLEQKQRLKAAPAPGATTPVKSPIASFADVEAMRIKRLENATNIRYTYSNYPGLRSKDNFARGSLFNKQAVKDSFLVFTMDEIPKSLTEMKFPDHNKLSLQVSYTRLYNCFHLLAFVLVV